RSPAPRAAASPSPGKHHDHIRPPACRRGPALPATARREADAGNTVQSTTLTYLSKFREDSDYVFVNLFAEPRGQALSYPAVHDLVAQLRRRTGLEFGPHWCR